MADYNKSGSGDLDAVDNVGNKLPSNGLGSPSTFGVTLAAGTYYFPLGSELSTTPSEAALAAVHIKWALAVTGTITLETSNFPATVGARGSGSGAVDVSDYDSTAGNWVKENPSTAYVGGALGSGNSVASMTVTMGGTTADGVTLHIGNLGTRRARMKIVTTVGGLVRVSVRGKSGV